MKRAEGDGGSDDGKKPKPKPWTRGSTTENSDGDSEDIEPKSSEDEVSDSDYG
jgi:hypothetical protein